MLWLLLTPAALLALNGQAGPAFQLRYTLAIVPAWALLLARGIVPRPLPATAPRVLRGALALALIAVQLAAYDAIWPPKPRWDEAVRGAAAARAPLEPALSWLDPQSPAAYYDRLYGLSAGLTLKAQRRFQLPVSGDGRGVLVFERST
ncbi:MAG: hypothetical protein IAE78_10605 [Myxococcus sp.]|nr:hypothetical protein [Myxococcus sp.]